MSELYKEHVDRYNGNKAYEYDFEETLEVSGSNSEDYEDFKEEFAQLCAKYGYETTI